MDDEVQGRARYMDKYVRVGVSFAVRLEPCTMLQYSIHSVRQWTEFSSMLLPRFKYYEPATSPKPAG